MIIVGPLRPGPLNSPFFSRGVRHDEHADGRSRPSDISGAPTGGVFSLCRRSRRPRRQANNPKFSITLLRDGNTLPQCTEWLDAKRALDEGHVCCVSGRLVRGFFFIYLFFSLGAVCLHAVPPACCTRVIDFTFFFFFFLSPLSKVGGSKSVEGKIALQRWNNNQENNTQGNESRLIGSLARATPFALGRSLESLFLLILQLGLHCGAFHTPRETLCPAPLSIDFFVLYL